MNSDTKKILIVEDEKPMAHALVLKFTSSGFDAESVGDGEAAVEKIMTGAYNIVLLDLIIPKKDGFSVLADVKAKGNTTPIIVTSNLSQQDDENKALGLGASGYIIKSNTPIAEIVVKVKELLHIK